MSVHAVERVFWEFGNKPALIDEFLADPDAYLAQYPALTADERRMVKSVDLKGLSDHGVSNLLTMMVWPLLKGADGMPFDYLTHMNAGRLPDMGLPPLKAAGLKAYIRFRNARAEWLRWRRKRRGEDPRGNTRPQL